VAEQHRLPERASDAMSGVGKAQFETSVKSENQPIEKANHIYPPNIMG